MKWKLRVEPRESKKEESSDLLLEWLESIYAEGYRLKGIVYCEHNNERVWGSEYGTNYYIFEYDPV